MDDIYSCATILTSTEGSTLITDILNTCILITNSFHKMKINIVEIVLHENPEKSSEQKQS